jgi:C-terminal processing protease CtpA/Prc
MNASHPSSPTPGRPRIPAAVVAGLLAVCQCSGRTIEAYPEALVGIGVVLRSERAGPVIGEVIRGGPAADAGLAAGDLLLEVDGEPTLGRPLASVVAALRGVDGSSVVVKVRGPRGLELVTMVRRPLARGSGGYEVR